MGYPMTYHPISPDEMLQWYFEPLDNAERINKLAEKYGFQAESFHEFFTYGRDHLCSESEYLSELWFEETHGVMLASAQTFFAPYYLILDGVFSELLENHANLFEKYCLPIHGFVPEKFRCMKFYDRLGEEERSSGVYIPPNQAKQLLHDLHNDSEIAVALLKAFDPNGFLLLYSALQDAVDTGRGLLEAVEIPLACEFDGNNIEYRVEAMEFTQDTTRQDEIVALFTGLDCVEELHGWPDERPQSRLTALDIRRMMLVPTVTRREMPTETSAWFQWQLDTNRKKLKPDRVKTIPGAYLPYRLKPDWTDLGYAIAWFVAAVIFPWCGWNVWQGNWAVNNWSDRLLPYIAVLILPFLIYEGVKRLRSWLGQPKVDVEMEQESIALGEKFRFAVLIDGPMECKHLSAQFTCESFRNITDSGVPPYQFKGPLLHYEFPVFYLDTVILRDGEQKVLEKIEAYIHKEFPYSTTMRGGHPFPWTMKWQIQWTIDIVVQWQDGTVRRRRFPFAVKPAEKKDT